ncbi:MAG: DoxX family membrane protein [bacterium]|nr:DoxX family membrane protein [bacterium]
MKKFEEMNFLLSHYAPVVLRLGIASVFMWFGVSQISNPSMWTNFIPLWALSTFSLSAQALVLMNGTAEIIGALLLVLNIFARWVALFLALHLFGIAYTIGFNPTGVRDFGLSVATLYIFLKGEDDFSIF